MKKTAIAPSNIAFVKYWGKRDSLLRLPLNDSLSMNLDHAHTTTTVEFSNTLKADTVEMIAEGRLSAMGDKESNRVIRHLDVIREKTGLHDYARVVTKNSFPMGVGAASSASGFAALTEAAVAASGALCSEKERTVLARMGSGSACRSIPDGFVIWKTADTSDQSYAYSLYPHTHWNLVDTIVFVDTQKKKISTSDGMDAVKTSPFWEARLNTISGVVKEVSRSIEEKDIHALGESIEAEMFSMHSIMMTQTPALVYWTDATIRVFQAVWQLRSEGIPAYCTVDAGPNVHVISEHSFREKIKNTLSQVSGVRDILTCHASTGTHIIEEHLF